MNTNYPLPYLNTLKVYRDYRGRFFETFQERDYNECFVQDNSSSSAHNVLRGLHYQVPPMAQAKIIRVTHGKIFDLALDLRTKSPTFGKYFTYYMSEEIPQTLYIPEGFAHGFCVISSWADVSYKCSAYFSPEHERTILYSDPTLNIPWPTEYAILSEKDKKGTFFLDAEYFVE